MWKRAKAQLSEHDILQALDTVALPGTDQRLSSGDYITSLTMKDGRLRIVIALPKEWIAHSGALHHAWMEALAPLPLGDPQIILTAHEQTPIPAAPETGHDAPRQRAVWNRTPLAHVARVIAVASGKGGVGKSTVTVNLAHALAAKGQRVGILDADIYGPSLPRMMGLHGQPPIADGKMQPLVSGGIACMSMGFITGDEAAVLRGPMISKALTQMLRATAWGSAEAPLDVLLVDMPPGTGDIHLSMAQQVPLSGAIIVTTPQEVAVIDARKCAEMFVKVDVPLIGIIENMSYLLHVGTGERMEIFGRGGGAFLAKTFSVPLLGTIPLDADLRAAADDGQDYLKAAPTSGAATSFAAIADQWTAST